MPSTAVVWFRRDLRLGDNPALCEAVRAHDRVVPLFVWDDRLLRPAGAARTGFLAGCAAALRDAFGGRLVTRRGAPERAVPALVREVDASEVLAAEDFGPYGRLRDGRVAQALAAEGRPLRFVGSPYAVAPGRLFGVSGGPYRVFRAFHRAWLEHGWDAPLPAPELQRVSDAGAASDRDPPLPGPAAPGPPGEAAGMARLGRFAAEGLDGYGARRDRLDLDATSRLSPYLRFGCVHPRQVLSLLDLSRPGHGRLGAELCWRDFFADVLHHRPDAAREPYRAEWRHFEVDTGPGAESRFEAWAEGRTGYPVVDAAMRHLAAEGWMPNRARMVTASFLVKDLHLDWRTGARWFMRHLADGDLASNQLNWQWVAGCGTDAAPFFRVFNPVAQGRRFDPDGDYVRRWVSELAGVPGSEVHRLGGGGYRPPLVDHASERAEALRRFSRLSAFSVRGRTSQPQRRSPLSE
ncbi:MAG TPA: deoxyribodipyrimidine photo-lyase [Acidimicrobiales bacterium]|nr:deoxyribodipyrimidine photo-lyase [Acidimicrobiales bacterium]